MNGHDAFFDEVSKAMGTAKVAGLARAGMKGNAVGLRPLGKTGYAANRLRAAAGRAGPLSTSDLDAAREARGQSRLQLSIWHKVKDSSRKGGLRRRLP